MDIFKVLHTRRSVRKFTAQQVSQEDIQILLEAAMTAPSAGNAQPWHFVVTTKRELLDKMPDFHPYAAMAKQATVGVLICADPTLEKHVGFWVQDCSAATQNLLLAARGLGLGAVWTGIYPVEKNVQKVSELFKLPQHIVPLSFICVGHTDVEQKVKERFKPERIHWDSWE